MFRKVSGEIAVRAIALSFAVRFFSFSHELNQQIDYWKRVGFALTWNEGSVKNCMSLQI